MIPRLACVEMQSELFYNLNMASESAHKKTTGAGTEVKRQKYPIERRSVPVGLVHATVG